MSSTFKTVPTQNGPRSGDDVVTELFILARSERTQSGDGAAFVTGERDGEQIEIRVTVRSLDYAAAVKNSAQK